MSLSFLATLLILWSERNVTIFRLDRVLFFHNHDSLEHFRNVLDYMDALPTQPRTNWDMGVEYNGSKRRKTNSYPYYTFGAGFQFSLIIVLKMNNEDIEQPCEVGHDGFKVMFAQPSEALHKLHNFYRIPLNRTTMFTIQPKLTITSGNIHTYKPHIRGCYVNSERPLLFFKHYTQRNCEMECLTNYTLAQCGCVKFAMPSTTQNVHSKTD